MIFIYYYYVYYYCTREVTIAQGFSSGAKILAFTHPVTRIPTDAPCPPKYPQVPHEHTVHILLLHL